eukprot:scaffold217275_cov40-Prasinocladus_malaysianus.AAC.1
MRKISSLMLWNEKIYYKDKKDPARLSVPASLHSRSVINHCQTAEANAAIEGIRDQAAKMNLLAGNIDVPPDSPH